MEKKMKTLINTMNAIGSISGDRELDEFINENDLRNTITFADYFMAIERLKYKKAKLVLRKMVQEQWVRLIYKPVL